MKVLFLFLAILSFTSCGKKDTNDTNNGPIGESSILKISSFNVQIFGDAFMSDSLKVNELIKIIKRYDILMIQEIRDADGDSIVSLQSQLNDSTDDDYELVVSSRLGRTSSKEQYAFFYKRRTVSLISCIQFSDVSDIFEREPYTCRFKNKVSNGLFSLIALHAKPDDVINELNALKSVFDDMIIESGDSNIIAMGDFNSDCSYLSSTEYSNLDFNTANNFVWQISQDSDTTTSSTNCAYDNFITTDEFSQKIRSSGVFNFGQEYGLSLSLTQDISDHYPIELDLNI